MAESNPSVQKTGYRMLNGVVDEAEVARLEGLIGEIRTLVEEVRADVVPISLANFLENPGYVKLLNEFSLFQAKYGFTVPDMDLNLNPIFAAVESRLDVAENQIQDLLSKYAILADQFNKNTENIKKIAQATGVPIP